MDFWVAQRGKSRHHNNIILSSITVQREKLKAGALPVVMSKNEYLTKYNFITPQSAAVRGQGVPLLPVFQDHRRIPSQSYILVCALSVACLFGTGSRAPLSDRRAVVRQAANRHPQTAQWQETRSTCSVDRGPSVSHIYAVCRCRRFFVVVVIVAAVVAVVVMNSAGYPCKHNGTPITE